MKEGKISLKLSENEKNKAVKNCPKEFGEIDYNDLIDFNVNGVFISVIINLMLITILSSIKIINIFEIGYTLDNIVGIILALSLFFILRYYKVKEKLDEKVLNKVKIQSVMLGEHRDNVQFKHEEKLWYKFKVINVIVAQMISIICLIIIPITIGLLFKSILISNSMWGIIIYGLIKCNSNFGMIAIIVSKFSFNDNIIVPSKSFIIIEDINPFFIKLRSKD